MTQPSTIGSYKVVRQLGSGLMGPVYLAANGNQYWALRTLDERLMRTTAAVSKLVGEVAHPSLVRYREIGADPQAGGFLSTDYVEAHPIARDLLADLRARERLDCVLNLLSALQTLHQRGGAHGNVKPSNVLLRRRGRQLDALLIDAGFAYVSGAHNLARLLRGAYPWMAPELIEAYQVGERGGIDKAITVAADVYAAGILVAEVFSGRQAFADARDVADLLNRKRRSKLAIAGVNLHHEHLDLGTLGDAVAAATNPDPGSRPATIPAFIDALKRAQPAPAPLAKAA
jgi:serine/threonine-protein kinase